MLLDQCEADLIIWSEFVFEISFLIFQRHNIQTAFKGGISYYLHLVFLFLFFTDEVSHIENLFFPTFMITHQSPVFLRIFRIYLMIANPIHSVKISCFLSVFMIFCLFLSEDGETITLILFREFRVDFVTSPIQRFSSSWFVASHVLQKYSKFSLTKTWLARY